MWWATNHTWFNCESTTSVTKVEEVGQSGIDDEPSTFLMSTRGAIIIIIINLFDVYSRCHHHHEQTITSTKTKAMIRWQHSKRTTAICCLRTPSILHMLHQQSIHYLVEKAQNWRPDTPIRNMWSSGFVNAKRYGPSMRSFGEVRPPPALASSPLLCTINALFMLNQIITLNVDNRTVLLQFNDMNSVQGDFVVVGHDMNEKKQQSCHQNSVLLPPTAHCW